MQGKRIQAGEETTHAAFRHLPQSKVLLLLYLIVLTEMQYFHIRFHIALPSPFMTSSEVFAKLERFQVTQGTRKFSSIRKS